MSDEDKLASFVEEIMAISPQYINIFGGGMPGMAGGSAGIEGAANSGADVALQLQRAAIEFAKLYRTTDNKDITTVRREVTGKIMVAHTLGVITQQRADDLLDKLAQLVKERN